MFFLTEGVDDGDVRRSLRDDGGSCFERAREPVYRACGDARVRLFAHDARECRAEPKLAFDGGADGLDIIRRILQETGRHLTPEGGLLCEIGRGRDMLEAAFPQLPLLWLDTEESAGEVFWIGAADL